MNLARCPENPIIVPGKYEWRKAACFNPAAIYDEGVFYLIERAAGGLRPFHCFLGLLKSADGIHFSHVRDTPVVAPADFGFPFGSIQDPRLVKIEGRYYLTYALRPSSYGYAPTGIGKPEEIRYTFPGEHGRPERFMTRSGIMVSDDLIHWTQIAYTTPFDINDRDNILFPEKIGGKFALLRRPEEYIGATYGTDTPGIWLAYSDDLREWSEPVLVAAAEQPWEGKKIGGSAPPIKTEAGWLTLYHGVDADNVYRAGVMLLDRENPSKVIARAKNFILEPVEYYERFGLYIPNVVFPTAAVVKDGIVYIYYGVTDTAIACATVPLAELLNFTLGG
ncbi:MAG: glycosidase [Spirochaetaceae bacterium]|jgi:predicted GH43/DUF377 family glycosyl hydrolase|nr:glycosidase [Spirochaetaceae bacterium]